MNKKNYLILASLFWLANTSLFTQVEPDVTFEKSKEVKALSKAKKVAIGVEGGWNESFRVGGLSGGHIAGTGRLGINIIAGKMIGKVMPKYTWETGIGYIFVGPFSFSNDRFNDLSGWGLYFHGTFHRNFRIKNSVAYFYTGYGFGVDMSAYQEVGDINMQLVRLPLGFKFLLGSATEIFLEANFGMGLTMTSVSTLFSVDTDLKGGVRFWI